MELAHPMAQFIVRAHSMAGSTRGRAASRSSDAADSPPTSVVFSKCGVGKDLGAKTKKLFQCNPCSPARDQEPICLQHLRFPKFLLVSLIGSLKFNPKGDAILFVSGDFWVEKKMFKILIYQKSKPKSYNFKVDAK